MSDVLVVYYSRKGENYMPGGIQSLEKGHTERAAEYIREALGADLFEIETAAPYAAGYRECCVQAAEEMKANARPEIRGYVDDISRYNTIFVCFPCWCGTAPMCVFTFLEHYDLAGKKSSLSAPTRAAAWQTLSAIWNVPARMQPFSPDWQSRVIRSRAAGTPLFPGFSLRSEFSVTKRNRPLCTVQERTYENE